MPFAILAEETPVVLAPLGDLIKNIGSGATWLFSLFKDFMGIIASNDLILYPVLFGICAGAVITVIAVVRKFGVKSRTR